MQKEILTKAIIEKELKKFYPKNLLAGLLFFPFYALMCFLLVFFFILFINLLVRDKVTLNIIAGIIFAILAVIYFQAFASSIKVMLDIRKNNYTISTDWVVDKLPRVISRYYNSRPNTLVFARGGEYYIPDNNYKWSKLYAMNDESVFNSTKIDDDFYVVSSGKYKNILAYNKRMFELVEITSTS